jgi:hypothetical protein
MLGRNKARNTPFIPQACPATRVFICAQAWMTSWEVNMTLTNRPIRLISTRVNASILAIANFSASFALLASIVSVFAARLAEAS